MWKERKKSCVMCVCERRRRDPKRKGLKRFLRLLHSQFTFVVKKFSISFEKLRGQPRLNVQICAGYEILDRLCRVSTRHGWILWSFYNFSIVLTDFRQILCILTAFWKFIDSRKVFRPLIHWILNKFDFWQFFVRISTLFWH